MRIPIELILERMEPLQPEAYLKALEMQVTGFRLLPANREGLCPDHLYFGDLEDVTVPDDGLTIVAACGEPGFTPPEAGRGCILLRTSASVFPLFNALLDLQMELTQWETALQHSMEQNKGIQDLLIRSEEMFGNPIVVMNSGLKCLASTRRFDTEDRNFHELLTLGYTTQETFHFLKERGFFTADHYTGETLVMPAHHKKYTNTFTALSSEGKVQFIVMMLFCNRPYTPGTLKLYEILLDKLRYYLTPSLQGGSYEQYGFLMVDLIENRCSPQEIEERSACFPFLQSATYNTLVIELAQPDVMHLDHLHQQVSAAFPLVKSLVYKDSLLLHTDLGDHRRVTNGGSIWTLETLDKLLEAAHARAGISRSFDRLQSMSLSYAQARSALELGAKLRPEQRILWYDEVDIHDLLYRAERQEAPYEAPDRVLRGIMAYDAAHATQYAHILREYLRLERNYSKTGQALNMHRNNVIYHIERITEKFGLDLDDDRERLRLLLAYLSVEL